MIESRVTLLLEVVEGLVCENVRKKQLPCERPQKSNRQQWKSLQAGRGRLGCPGKQAGKRAGLMKP